MTPPGRPTRARARPSRYDPTLLVNGGSPPHRCYLHLVASSKEWFLTIVTRARLARRRRDAPGPPPPSLRSAPALRPRTQVSTTHMSQHRDTRKKRMPARARAPAASLQRPRSTSVGQPACHGIASHRTEDADDTADEEEERVACTRESGIWVSKTGRGVQAGKLTRGRDYILRSQVR
jgi:hypothetical protein